jgi:hypothetical protein
MKTTLIILCVAAMMSRHALGSETPTLEGTWKFVPEKSTDIVTWRYRVLQLEIAKGGQGISIVHNWMERSKVAFADTFFVRTLGETSQGVVHSAIWPDNWYMGVLSEVGGSRSVSAEWVEEGKALRVVTDQPVKTSQGKTVVTTRRDYRLSPDGSTLTLTEQRSSRTLPVVLFFERVKP